MLVLTRKKDEQIRIGDHILITVLRVKGKSVRLGIQAPRTEPVLRGELEFRERRLEVSGPLETVECLCVASDLAESRMQHGPQRPLREFLLRERRVGE